MIVCSAKIEFHFSTARMIGPKGYHMIQGCGSHLVIVTCVRMLWTVRLESKRNYPRPGLALLKNLDFVNFLLLKTFFLGANIASTCEAVFTKYQIETFAMSCKMIVQVHFSIHFVLLPPGFESATFKLVSICKVIAFLTGIRKSLIDHIFPICNRYFGGGCKHH